MRPAYPGAHVHSENFADRKSIKLCSPRGSPACILASYREFIGELFMLKVSKFSAAALISVCALERPDVERSRRRRHDPQVLLRVIPPRTST